MTSHLLAQTPPVGTAEICLANAQLVLENRIMKGAIHLQGDRIVGITAGRAVPAGAIDIGGDYLLAGLVELHTDNLERHIQPRPKVELPHITAILAHDGELASVGITTVFDALRVGSIEGGNTNYGKYARKVANEILALRANDALRVRHLLHLRAEVCSDSLIEELNEFNPSDHVGLISLMDHTPGQRQFRDLSKLRIYLAGKYNLNDAEFAAHVEKRRKLRALAGDKHEKATIDAAARFGATLASHDDTTAKQVAHSHSLGIQLGEFPTTLEAAEACRDAGIQIIMGAPNLIRGGSHSGNVSACDLAARGLLDIISSDYVPSLLLASAFRLADIWGDLPRAVRTITTTPANATGLSDRGRIAPECLGDLVQVHMLNNTPVIRAVWRGGARVG